MAYLIATVCLLVAGIGLGIGLAVFSLRKVNLNPDEPHGFK